MVSSLRYCSGWGKLSERAADGDEAEKRTFYRGVVMLEPSIIDEPHGQSGLADTASCRADGTLSASEGDRYGWYGTHRRERRPRIRACLCGDCGPVGDGIYGRGWDDLEKRRGHV